MDNLVVADVDGCVTRCSGTMPPEDVSTLQAVAGVEANGLRYILESVLQQVLHVARVAYLVEVYRNTRLLKSRQSQRRTVIIRSVAILLRIAVALVIRDPNRPPYSILRDSHPFTSIHLAMTYPSGM